MFKQFIKPFETTSCFQLTISNIMIRNNQACSCRHVSEFELSDTGCYKNSRAPFDTGKICQKMYLDFWCKKQWLFRRIPGSCLRLSWSTWPSSWASCPSTPGGTFQRPTDDQSSARRRANPSTTKKWMSWRLTTISVCNPNSDRWRS